MVPPTFRDAAFRLRPTNGTAVFQELFHPPQLSGLATAVSDALLSTYTCYLTTRTQTERFATSVVCFGVHHLVAGLASRSQALPDVVLPSTHEQ